MGPIHLERKGGIVMKLALIAVLTLVTICTFANSRVRHVEVHGDQIIKVRTSTGIATIIQVPDRPNSVVVGNQDSFKVEYLDQAITIKPLFPGAKSNLYVYTDWKRYNIELNSGSENVADYVVYLDNPKKKSPSLSNTGITWTTFKNSLRNENFELIVTRLGRTKQGILLVEFSVKAAHNLNFKPEWIWLTQNGKTKPIHNLFLSDLKVSSNKSISGVIQLKKDDFFQGQPIRIEIRRKRLSYLTLPKVTAWK